MRRLKTELYAKQLNGVNHIESLQILTIGSLLLCRLAGGSNVCALGSRGTGCGSVFGRRDLALNICSITDPHSLPMAKGRV